MSAESVACVGFAHPDRRTRQRDRRGAVVVHLIATLALSVSIAVAAIAVSIGIARAEPLPAMAAGGRTADAIHTYVRAPVLYRTAERCRCAAAFRSPPLLP